MTLKAKPIQKFAAADGSEHNTAQEAVEHNKYLLRVKQLTEMFDGELVADVTPGVTSDDRENATVYVEDVPKFIAANADRILAALDVTQRRGPRKPKSSAEQTAG